MFRPTAKAASLGCLLLTSCIPLFPVAPSGPAQLTIEASVTSVDATTGVPQTLSGTITGDLTGTYSESILQVVFDGDGNLIGALSVSQFTFDTPEVGTISSTNIVTVTGPILLTDDSGNTVVDESGSPTVIGLETAATGDLLNGSGAFAGTFGNLQTDSDLLFTGGDMELGTASTSLQLYLAYQP